MTILSAQERVVNMPKLLGLSSNKEISQFTSFSQQKNIWIGFWGTTRPGSRNAEKDSFCNAVLAEIHRESGLFNMYFQSQRDQAIHDLLYFLDKNKDLKISNDELKPYKIRVLGFSWGAISAVEFTNFFDWKMIRTVEHKSSFLRHSSRYKFNQIDIKSLVIIDPVLFFRKNTKTLEKEFAIGDNVENFYNLFQTQGGKSEVSSANGDVKYKFGNFLSSNLRGSPIKRVKHRLFDFLINANKDKPWSNHRAGRQFHSNKLFLAGKNVNHDTITWFAKSMAIHRLRCPYD